MVILVSFASFGCCLFIVICIFFLSDISKKPIAYPLTNKFPFLIQFPYILIWLPEIISPPREIHTLHVEIIFVCPIIAIFLIEWKELPLNYRPPGILITQPDSYCTSDIWSQKTKPDAWFWNLVPDAWFWNVTSGWHLAGVWRASDAMSWNHKSDATFRNQT